MTGIPAIRRLQKCLLTRPVSARATSVRAAGLSYLSPVKFRRIERCFRELAWRRVPGDYAEFGVALGGAGIVIAHAAHAGGRRFHGFDVFGMIPPPVSDKDDAKSRDRFQVISAGQSTGLKGAEYYGYRDDLYGDVAASFAQFGVPVDGEKTSLYKGLFEDTLPGAPLDALAFAHIDCDWYDPVRFCLDRLADRMAPGGAMVIDDYHDYGGCKQAVDEFLAARPDFLLEPGRNPILWRSAG